VQLNELPAQGQPQPGTFHLLVRRPHLSELLEHRLLILRGDADPGVADGDLDRPVPWDCHDFYSPTLWRELDRVRQQVQDDLPDLPLICPNLAQPLIDTHLQCDAPSSRPLADQGQGVVERRGEMEVRQLQLHPPGLDL
jgi:hypothetical protein